MLDALGVAVCLADARDADAPLLYVNAAFEEITGWTADDALGRGLEAVLGRRPARPSGPGARCWACAAGTGRRCDAS